MSKNKQIDQIKKEVLVSLVKQIPFCKTLGIKLDCLGNEITAHLPFKKDFIGNPAIPALHGGIIGSFLERILFSSFRDETVEANALIKLIPWFTEIASL